MSTWSIPTLENSDNDVPLFEHEEDNCSIDSASTWMTMPGLAEPMGISSSFLCEDDSSDKDEAPLSRESTRSMPTLLDCSSDDDDDDIMPALEDPSAKQKDLYCVQAIGINGQQHLVLIWDPC